MLVLDRWRVALLDGHPAAVASRRILAEESGEDVVVLEIKDTNGAALGLYCGVGFVELRRRPARFAGRAGFREYVDVTTGGSTPVG